MIRRIEAKNFRCLRDVAVDLEPLTVLVGPNGSGKSSLVRALEPKPWTVQDHWQHQQEPAAEIHITLDSGTYEANTGHTHPGDGRYTFQRLQLDVQNLRHPNQLRPETQLATDGANLTNVFETLTRKQQTDFARRFCSLVPTFADVDTVPSGSGHKILRFQDRWASDVWYTPHEVSDGTMLMVAFLALTYQTPPVDIVAIEEPERGLHPYLIGELIGLLRGLSVGSIGARPVQIILATHSAELLEHVHPEEVRFFDRTSADGSVQVTRVDTRSSDWERAFEEYRQSLGSAWLSGGLGGVPSGAAE